MDHVSTFAECAACAVSAVCRKRGLSGRAAAWRLKVSPATGSRWARAIRMRSHADPAAQGRPPGKGKLAPYQAFFEELLAQAPDIALFELRDAPAAAEGIAVHHSSIAALRSRLGFTYKKIAGGHRAPPCQGKAGAARLACASPARHGETRESW